jgi:FtsH-binding integral membrane protein
MNVAEVASIIVFALWETFWVFFAKVSAHKGKNKIALSWFMAYVTLSGVMQLAIVFGWYARPASALKSDLLVAVLVSALGSVGSMAIFGIVSLRQQRDQAKL